MEDDDEFGDLYTDILLPTTTPTPTPTPAPSKPSPPQTLTRPDANPSTNPTSSSSAAAAGGGGGGGAADDDWLLGEGDAAAAAVEAPSNWADDEDGGESGPAAAPPPPILEEPARFAGKEEEVEEEADPLLGGGMGDAGAAIPGLSSAAGPVASEDWDSDSEDDIQIVLNEADDRRHHLHGSGDIAGDDEDGEEDLVIVADDHHHLPAMEEQDWGEDAAAAAAAGSADGEKKEGGEAGKAAASSARIGYSGSGGPAFHPQHNSFKYVRPGATPGASVGGSPGTTAQFRPPLPQVPFAGRGRGDWRPVGGRGMNKGFHSGYGMPAWGGSGRGFGGGLDFTLPSHKTVFEVDIDTTFEEKPWKYPGADISDFFNFGLDEEKWKDYCKMLDQLRLESTMQSRIRVYESGRSEQDYDPDLPPELAAAAGHHDISADNRNKADTVHNDFNGQGRVPAGVRPPMMTGRPIQVETGYGERLPSIDTRLPRIRESDAIIEIVLQGPLGDPMVVNGATDQPEKDSQGDSRGAHGVVEDGHYPLEKTNNFPQNSTLGKRGPVRQVPLSSEGDDVLNLPKDSNTRYPPNYKMRGPASHGVRTSQVSSLARDSGAGVENSTDTLPRQTTFPKRHSDSQREKPLEGSELRDASEGSPAAPDEAVDELSTEDKFDDNGERLALVDSIEAEGEDAMSDPRKISEANGDGNLVHSGKKRKLISRVEQPTGHDYSDEDDLRTLNSDTSRGRSGSSKDRHKRPELGEEVVQDGRSRRPHDRRYPDGEERNSCRKDDYHRDVKPDIDRTHISSRNREDVHYPYASRDRDIRGRSYDRAKDIEIWQRREDSLHSRRPKEEDMRLEHNAEATRHRSKRPIDRNDKDEDLRARRRLDDGDWRGSRQRERSDMVMNRRENLDDSHIKRKKDEESLRRAKPETEDIMPGYKTRDDSNRRKRERDDGIDPKRRDDSLRMREKAEDHYRAKHKDDNLRRREREDRQRPKQSHENTLTLQREEGRGTVRSGRVVGDKSLVAVGRKKHELKSAALGKEIQERGRKNEPSKRESGEENAIQNKGRGDAHPREKQPNNSERNRQEKMNIHDNSRLSSASDTRLENRDRHKENTRKGRGAELNEQDLHRASKKRREDHESHRNEKVEMKGANEQERERDYTALSKKSHSKVQEQLDVPKLRDSLVKQGEDDAVSDDENQDDSRRGRSKLERWTSHKEIDYSTIDNGSTQTFSSIKEEVQASNADELGKSEAPVAAGSSELKSGDTGQMADRTIEERDRHLDTVERLKRRSERFKLPMPGEKEAAQSKKVENELQPPQNETTAADLEVKPERPARKRRWTGS